MGNVEIPEWLKGLPLAPEFRPTDTEFADPIAYISKIEKEASAFGICKVIPPLPKPSKRYVLTNLNKSLSRSCELGSVNSNNLGDFSKRVSGDKINGSEFRAVFTTRQQELGQSAKRNKGPDAISQPAAQKQVWQSGEVYTLEQFESKSKAFSRTVLGHIKEVNPLVIEGLFWKAASEKPIYVEYANDVPGSGFGEPEGLLRYFGPRKRRRRLFARNHQGRSYCVQENMNNVRNPCSSYPTFSEPGKEISSQPTSSLNENSQSTNKRGVCSGGEVEGSAGWKLSNSPWNLQVIARSAGSLTRFMLDDIPGVTSPMVYIGMLFSWFAWHVEDHELHSLNFLHIGSPKTWYAVPGEYAFAFEEVIRRHAYGGDMDHFAALKLLGEKTTLLSPELLAASGIPCCRLVQNPGEFVVTFPRAYHVGFSHGFNCGEAANFGTPQWLTVAKQAAVRRAAMDHLPMLSHQQLLYLLTMSFISRVPKSLLPGVRSSRLRDRLREDRELLVKKAFIQDVLEENKLLNTLLRKDSAFRAVLWHPDLLPSFTKEPLSQMGIASNLISSRDDELSSTPCNNAIQDGLIHQLSSFTETVNDLYLGSDDLSCDFQVDSGTLPCVACGILGYPFMTVVQPSKKASMEIFPAENFTNTGAIEISATNRDEGWDTSGFLRPRILCLEHAIQIEERLRPKGGARLLVICHSDYRKIKANAAAVAEEIKTDFNYKEVPLDSASQEELKIIDLTIDGEQLNVCQEDWTSKLGINLQYSVKARNSCPSKKIDNLLNLDYLPSLMAPGLRISSIKWCSRKSRTKTKTKNRKLGKSCDGNPLERDPIIHQSEGSMEIKEKVLLYYSRRKYRFESRNPAGEKCASGCRMESSPADASCGKIDAIEQSSNLVQVNSPIAEELSGEEMVPTEVLTSTSDDSNFPGKMKVDENTNLVNNEASDAEKSKISGDNNMREFENGTLKHDCFSTCTEATTTMELDVSAFPKENCPDHPLIGSPVNKKRDKKDKTMANAKVTSGNRSKRQGQLAEIDNVFIKSPCEGLRPRKQRKEDDTHNSVISQNPPNKKIKKSSNSSKGSYKCGLEGCRMWFKTSSELSLHKRNRCHFQECGKKFRSHKYVVLHQRVHDDDRPLKCPWKGCAMSFKWPWARTEHLRLHTGERPYECKVEGCGLTFRFVSDFSRHRRKFGHYVNLPT